MLSTRTGSFSIGFRRMGSPWQSDIHQLIEWSKQNGLGVIDVAADPATVKAITDAGLKVGSVDITAWSGLTTDDEAKRKESLDKNAELIEAATAAGGKNFFAVMLPADPSKPRSENFKLMIEGLKPLAAILEKFDGKLVIEGWPGPGALACTPESYRDTINAVGSKAIGINYDPSHLIRMGIDPIRFVEEFATSIFHCHGKDTEVISEGLYNFGTEQPATNAKGHDFGSHHWRYTIPGHGQTRWVRAFEILAANGYKGSVCIEMEDENFNGTEETEKQGLLAGAHFLASC